jgi:hypothetical protein
MSALQRRSIHLFMEIYRSQLSLGFDLRGS